MIFTLLAHAGEHHETAVEAANHQASFLQWYTVVPLVTIVLGILLFVILQMLARGATGDKQDKQ